MTHTNTPASNDLRHTIDTHDLEGNSMRIIIRLNDECKNGHQDFAITADVWEKGKPKTDRYYIRGGCCHDEILKAHPELKIFVDLHSCDYKGIPMHAVANGFYHLHQGLNELRPGTAMFAAKYCDYYRITEQQYNALNQCENELQFAVQLKELGILKQWGRQAKAAISKMEEFTEKQFLVDSVRTQYVEPTAEQLAEEQAKQESGYYTPEAKAFRAKSRERKLFDKLMVEKKDKIKRIEVEYGVLEQVLAIGGEKALNNCLWHNHSNTLAFNWKGYDNISDELINSITAKLKLPEGAKIETKRH